MNIIFKVLKKYGVVLLLFFPLFYLFVGIYFRFIVGDLSLTSVDPDYVYYLSGVTISEGYFKVGHIDHPGTPLQYLIAIVLRITYLFRPDHTTFIQDIFANSDMYLSVVNICLTVLMVVSIFIAGKYVLKKTGSVIYAMVIQTIPFIPVIWYEIIGRVIPELILPIPIIALTAFFIGHLADEKEKFSLNDLLFISLMLAFSLSIKLTMIPLWIIPILIVKPWKSKLSVLAIAIILFLIIALPATLQIERFWLWAKNLFVHSGTYGGGDKNIVDLVAFKENFFRILHLYKQFTFLVAIQFVLIPASIFWNRRKNKAGIQKSIIAIAIVLTILFQALITAKHFAPRYFIPAIMFGPLLLLLSLEIIKEFHDSKILKIGTSIFLILFFMWHIRQQIIVINYTSEGVGSHVAAREETRHYIKTFEKESIKIIVSQGYGCPMPEYALLFSTAWAANPLRPHFTEELAKIYPNTYQYTTWDDRFRFWGEEFNPEKIIDQDIPVYVYLERNDEELYQKTVVKIFGETDLYNVNKELIFHNEGNGEAIIKLHLSSIN